MRSRLTGYVFLVIMVSVFRLQAQDKPTYKFGKIESADFEVAPQKFDSGANAIIISDIGSTRFEGNNAGFFTLIFTRYMRVKIMNKNGFDVGSFILYLYHSEDKAEKIGLIRGSTFNRENGAITETKLDEKAVFTEKYNERYDSKKFSMPALKEGSVFDIEYTIKSPYYRLLQSWEFQGKYPRLWSEYTVTIPPPFHYVMLMRGEQNFEVNTAKPIFSTFSIRNENGTAQSESYSMTGTSIQQKWAKKNVPSLHREPFTTNIDNYNSRVSFQLNYFQWNNENERHDYMETWTSACKTLMEDENFGLALSHENMWMSDELKSIVEGTSSDEERTARIFSYIRDNFKVTSEGIWALHSLKEVFKTRQGNVAEINLLLTAMLRKAGIRADPVILSTRDNGIANATYPLISEYNYVVTAAFPDNKLVVLDASQPYNGFGKIPEACYNGWAHIINETAPMPLEFSADSIRETTVTSVTIINDDNGKTGGSFKSILGKDGSYDLREEIGSLSLKDYQKKVQTAHGSDFTIDNLTIDSLKRFDFPITVNYEFDLKIKSEADILYFEPMMGENYKTNPFQSMDRHYPVEIPHLIDDTYILNMDIPKGYQVDEMPKSARVNYNGNDGLFEYLIQKGDGNLQMRVHLKLNKAFFPTEEYNTLRDFFAFIVKKEGEQIVFKKVK